MNRRSFLTRVPVALATVTMLSGCVAYVRHGDKERTYRIPAHLQPSSSWYVPNPEGIPTFYRRRSG
jgi:hypothetical protein